MCMRVWGGGTPLSAVRRPALVEGFLRVPGRSCRLLLAGWVCSGPLLVGLVGGQISVLTGTARHAPPRPGLCTRVCAHRQVLAVLPLWSPRPRTASCSRRHPHSSVPTAPCAPQAALDTVGADRPVPSSRLPPGSGGTTPPPPAQVLSLVTHSVPPMGREGTLRKRSHGGHCPSSCVPSWPLVLPCWVRGCHPPSAGPF